MRYIYYIAAILLGLSALIGFELRKNTGTTSDAAIIINNRVITSAEFEKLYSGRQPRSQSQADFINALITKELLIQESRKAGIDKEESFRRSIQNFYEQSLTKLLIDKKLASLNIVVPADEVERCASAWNKKFYITIFRFQSPEAAAGPDYSGGKQTIIYQEDLCGDIGEKVLLLKAGELTKPIKSGDQYLVVRLDRIESGPASVVTQDEKERVRAMLADKEKERILNDWISGLRKNASIKVLINEQK